MLANEKQGQRLFMIIFKFSNHEQVQQYKKEYIDNFPKKIFVYNGANLEGLIKEDIEDNFKT